MAGRIAGSDVSAGISFAHAGLADEGDIRRILREVPLGGSWSVALTREPDGFGGPHLPGERQDFILARDAATGEAVGLCERVVRPSFVCGEVVDLPYLGALRIVPSHRHRLSILKGGFATLRDHCELAGDFPFALTSITADNSTAKRVLTAGLRGLPDYRYLADFSTFALRPAHATPDPDIGIVGPDSLEELSAFLMGELALRDCAPVWTVDALTSLAGMRFLVHRGGGAITGCLGIWDQRTSRQAVLSDCPRAFRLLGGPMRLAARVAGYPPVPAIGQEIGQVFLSHMAVRGNDTAILLRLIRVALALATGAGAKSAVLGLPTGHFWRDAIKNKFRSIEYCTCLYSVGWAQSVKTDRQIDPERLFPEVALL